MDVCAVSWNEQNSILQTDSANSDRTAENVCYVRLNYAST
jgi:hypothetical protein